MRWVMIMVILDPSSFPVWRTGLPAPVCSMVFVRWLWAAPNDTRAVELKDDSCYQTVYKKKLNFPLKPTCKGTCHMFWPMTMTK